MPTWTLFKGEDKTFEGTVLIATSSDATPTNYDISNATLGFDMGSVMGNWFIRTNSLYGSLGRTFTPYGNCSDGTHFLTITNGPVALYSGREAWPFATCMKIQSASDEANGTIYLGVGTAEYHAPTPSGYFYSAFIRLQFGLPLKFNGITNFSSGTTFGGGGKTPTNKWQEYCGTLYSATTVTHWATLIFTVPDSGVHGLFLANVGISPIIATSSFQIMTGTMGVYRFSFVPADTENLTATSYYFDIWMRNGGKEYTLTVGTLKLKDVVGTF